MLLAALDALESDNIEPVDASPIISSAPLGPSRRRYANAVALVASTLSPPEMLERLHEIEASFGRRTGQRWSTRTLDLDILLWSGGTWGDAMLTVPHPAMTGRDFVLGPLATVAARWRHPLTGHSIRQLAVRIRRAKPFDQTTSLFRTERIHCQRRRSG